ncbi:MAG TPA: CinA family nicotinamide mononucleotide deamidase-related protein [Iamia sp.]|nr:CinA family nicotinamide mononucleotide deamidase-related protein [Iamia sp.]
MRCEVVAVGTELLLGQITDTNSSWIGEQLALVGIDSLRQTKVGDNLGRMVEVIGEAIDRADAVIVCGGLGPTQDDITRDAIARVMGVDLELDDEVAERIQAMFGGRGRRMPMNNLRQAEVPIGATAIADPQPGTAPGLLCPLTRPGPDGEPVEKVIYAVPGVPYEMMEIVTKAILPDLQRRAGITAVIRSRTLRTWGESESGLAEQLADRIIALDRAAAAGEAAGAVTIAFLASGIEGLKVRLTAKADTDEAVAALLAAEEAEVRAVLGPDLVFGTDDDTMESVVLALLGEQGLTLGLAESLTGGLVSSRITDVPGASKVFRGSIVSYATEVKDDVLGVTERPVVSAAAAEAMATGARRVLGADVGLALTGVAGPDEQDGERPGTVFVGLDLDGEVSSVRLQLPGDRPRVRQFSTISALGLLRARLAGRT